MKTRINIKSRLFSICMLLLSVLTFSACTTDELDVQYSYDYALEVMPYKTKITKGETIELRCELFKRGYYDGAEFTIRYFQPDGEGILTTDQGFVLTPNDKFKIARDVFRLYYKSNCEESQQIDIYIEDNLGQVQKYTFEWTNYSTQDDEQDA